MAVLIALFFWLPRQITPAEDADILYRYAENVAAGRGIVFNPGGPRAEGATDFAWMLLLAGLRALGAPCFASALALSMLAALGWAGLLARIGGRREPGIALGALTLVLLNPTLCASVQGFSVLLFGASLTLCLALAIERKSAPLYTAALAAALLRPDGAIFVAPVIALDLLRPAQPRERVARLRSCAALFVIPGLVYFLWRWHYFGLPWPLPFYVKALGVQRIAGLFVPSSLLLNLRLAALCAPLMLTAVRVRGLRRVEVAAPLAMAVSAVLFLSGIQLEQNVCARFQVPLIAAALGLAAVSVRDGGLSRRLWLGLFATLVLWTPGAATALLQTRWLDAEAPIVDLAHRLGDLPPARLATTEAGRLPLYSGWWTLDLWGLNEPRLARRLVQPVDVREARADLIALHSQSYDLLLRARPTEPAQARTWEGMLENTLDGMGNDYELWLVPFERPPSPTRIAWLQRLKEIDALEQLQRNAMRIYEHLRGRTAAAKYEAYLVRQDTAPQRYDLFGVRRAGPLAPRLRELLLEHGAITPAVFFSQPGR